MKTKANTPAAPTAGTLRRAAEFDAPRREWLVEGALLAGSPAVMAGGRVELTHFAVDLAVALATGTPFLGHLPVPRRRAVALYCCDDEPANVLTQAELVAAYRDTRLARADLLLGEQAPALGTRAGLEAAVAEARDAGVKVVIIDPIVRALRTGGDPRAPELFEPDRLVAVGTAFRDAGMTPVFTHRIAWTKQAPGIEGVSYAGLNDHARQWLLVSRLLPPNRHGRGAFRLTAGGVAGHAGAWDVRVGDGQLYRDFGGRTWNVTVTEHADAPVSAEGVRVAATGDDRRQGYEETATPKAKRRAGSGTR
jgi:hypothetical protein